MGASVNTSVVLHGDERIVASRHEVNGTTWLDLKFGSVQFVIIGSDVELDNLTAQVSHAATDYHLVREGVGATVVSADPVDWDRVSEDDLAMRGAYDDAADHQEWR